MTGSVPKARLDEARTALDVAERALSAIKAEQEVLLQTRAEGNVLSPADGRVLKVNVTKGTVVLAGEPMSSIAAQGYILRMQLPERHARFIKLNDKVQVAKRGVGTLTLDGNTHLRVGHIIQIYPEIKQGRVAVDAEVSGLGNFFVGERIRVWVETGDRTIISIPQTYIYYRHGLTFVTLQSNQEVVVQTGMAQTNNEIEILSGLNVGDVLVQPQDKPGATQ